MRELLGALLISFGLCVSSEKATAKSVEFVDEQNLQLRHLEPVARQMKVFFRDEFPTKIRVLSKKGNGLSKFDCATNTIVIDEAVPPTRKSAVIAHEAAHLGLCQLTYGANLKTEFRFLDEGFATLEEFRFLRQTEKFRERALRLSLEQLKIGNLGFDRVFDWRAYSRDSSGRINSYSYAVGASFIMMLFDRGGETNLRRFFTDLGRTENFEESLKSIFQMNLMEAEKEWKRFIINKGQFGAFS